jgi:hypothetical protein
MITKKIIYFYHLSKHLSKTDCSGGRRMTAVACGESCAAAAAHARRRCRPADRLRLRQWVDAPENAQKK